MNDKHEVQSSDLHHQYADLSMSSVHIFIFLFLSVFPSSALFNKLFEKDCCFFHSASRPRSGGWNLITHFAYETTKTAWRLAFIFHFWFKSLENLESDTKYSWHISLKNRSYLGYFLYKTQTPKLVSYQYPESSACCIGLHTPCLIISPRVIRQLWVADHV